MGEPGEGFIDDHEEGIAGVRILGPPMPPSGNGVRSVDLAGKRDSARVKCKAVQRAEQNAI